MAAAGKSDVDTLKLLVKLGSNVNHVSTRTGQTALLTAISTGSIEAVRALIELKADVNQRTKSGDTPLKFADNENQLEIVELLKKAGAKE
jgi:ankyrin repeat protein